MDRYVVLGLARPRADWFRSVTQWATSAVIPAEFVKCVSVEELRARLRTGRAYSAVLLDGNLPAVDRDAIETARSTGCVVFVVDDGPTRDWTALGATTVLPSSMSREMLLDALASHAPLVGRGSVSILEEGDAFDVPLRVGAVATVCGPGGTGASTVASSLAEGLASAGSFGDVLLADLTLHAEQAMLHDVRDVVPGIQELVEAHRSGRPSDDEIEAMTFHVVERRYRLLLGLRRSRYWSTIRPRAFDAAFESLRRRFGVTVCDVTADLEGEDDSGSADVAERNQFARTAVLAADVVFAVGRPGVKGLHALVRVLADLAHAGVPATRIVPVVNVAPRHPRARAELAGVLADLAAPAMAGGRVMPPIFLPARRVEDAVRDVAPMPSPLPSILAGAFGATVLRLGPAPATVDPAPELVIPGSLASWYDEEETA